MGDVAKQTTYNDGKMGERDTRTILKGVNNVHALVGAACMTSQAGQSAWSPVEVDRIMHARAGQEHTTVAG